MFTTLGATFFTTGATLVAALSSLLMGVSWMLSLGVGFVPAAAGAALARLAASSATNTAKLVSAADCLARENREILFMSFSCLSILLGGAQATVPRETPKSTF
jgi:hypothetical protein